MPPMARLQTGRGRKPRAGSSDDAPPFGALLARAYAGHWLDHSAFLVRHFPQIAERFGVAGNALCDVACGEGTFAVGMAKKGWRVVGVDRSEAMISLAESRARREHATASFIRDDMRSFHLSEPVDLVTCWYNSLNYLLTEDDLAEALAAMAGALVPGGWFLFDVYTLHGLESDWADRPWVAVDTADCFVVSRTRYDPATCRAEVTFTGFLRERPDGDAPHYVRFDEHHHHKGYSWATLKRLLDVAGFDVCGRFTMPDLGKPDRWTKRVYVAARKRG